MDGCGAKTAVITGAGSGIGRALSVAWARRGWRIGILDIDEKGAGRTLELVRDAGGSGEFYLCNVRHLEEVQSAADHFFGQWGEVALLVNNAGVVDAGIVGEIRIEDWERMLETSLWGAIYGCHAFIPGMKRQGWGHIVNTGSIAGFTSLPEMAPYNIAKAGVISLSETLRIELARFGIGVSVICPSVIDTNLLDSMTCTDEWERDFATAALGNAKMTAEELAEKVYTAVERNKLYIMPQGTAKLYWLLKRLAPATTFKSLTLVYKSRYGRSLFNWAAGKGIF